MSAETFPVHTFTGAFFSCQRFPWTIKYIKHQDNTNTVNIIIGLEIELNQWSI